MPVAADEHFDPKFAEHRRFRRQRQVRAGRIRSVGDLNVIALWRPIIWSRETPYVTACMIGHCGVVICQRRSVSSRGNSTTLPRPMSALSESSSM